MQRAQASVDVLRLQILNDALADGGQGVAIGEELDRRHAEPPDRAVRVYLPLEIEQKIRQRLGTGAREIRWQSMLRAKDVFDHLLQSGQTVCATCDARGANPLQCR